MAGPFPSTGAAFTTPMTPKRHNLRAVCIIAFALISGTPSVRAQSDHHLQLGRIASGNRDSITTAVKAISERDDANYYALMIALFNGELYLKNGELVIIGELREDDYGDGFAPLYAAYPRRQSILNADGDPLVAPLIDLEEIDGNRRIRALIQPYLTRMEIFHQDPIKRRVAAEILGNRGDAAAIPTLRHALAKETDGNIQNLIQVALGKLELESPDPAIRLDAAKTLRERNNTFVLSFLRGRVEPDADGTIAESNPAVQREIRKTIQWLETFERIVVAIQTTFVGISLGSILILIALGLAVIYGQIGIINMAHGEFMMVGAYFTFIVQNICLVILPAAYLDLFFFFSLPVAFLAAGSMGLLFEATVIRHLYNRPLESLLATWGIGLILVQLARTIFGDLTAVKLPQLLSGGFELAPQVILPYNRLFIIGFTGLILVALIAFFFKTRFGLRLRAVTQNRDMSACMGIPTRRVDAIAFSVGTGIAGIAGWAMTLIGNVVPNMGQTYIVDAFLVVVVGGVGKILGAVVAGLGIGISNKVIEPFAEAVYAKVLILGLIILFLQLRPTGIFPAKGRREDE